jgi:DNA-binding Lrp family transcriptional regulator
MELDLKDRKLLYALDKNSRESYVRLAKMVGLSKDAVKNRMKVYEKEDLISGYYAQIDYSKLGFFTLRIYFDFTRTDLAKEEEILLELSKLKEVWYLGRAEGSHQVHVGLYVKELSEYKELWDMFKNKFGDYISNENHSIFLELTYFNRDYLLNKEKSDYKKISLSKPEEIKIDNKDLKILEILSKNSREGIVDMFSKIKLTPKAIILRINKLEKLGIIFGYKTKINLEKIGYSHYKVDLEINDSKKKEEIKKEVFDLKNIIYSEVTLGGSDFEFDLECANNEEFQEVLDILKKKIGKNIKSLTFYKTRKVYKINYFSI